MGIGGGGKSSGCEIKERDVNHRRQLWIQGGEEETCAMESGLAPTPSSSPTWTLDALRTDTDGYRVPKSRTKIPGKVTSCQLKILYTHTFCL